MQSADGEASVMFSIQMASWGGSCVTVAWHVEHIQAVYLNNDGRTGEGSERICSGEDTPPSLSVRFTDNSLHRYGPEGIQSARIRAQTQIAFALFLSLIGLPALETLRNSAERSRQFARLWIALALLVAAVGLVALVWPQVVPLPQALFADPSSFVF